MNTPTPSRRDLYARVTDKIVADLERGVRTWARPWNAAHAAGPITRPLRFNGAPYRGINVLLLWVEAEARAYSAPLWMTYKQAAALGGQVRKGEHGVLVVIADLFTNDETRDDGQETERQVSLLKGYTVFNVERIDGLPAHYSARAQAPPPPSPCPGWSSPSASLR